MHEAQGAGDQRIGQLEIKLLDLGSEHQAFVDNGSTRKGGNKEGLLVLDFAGRDLVFRAAADDVEKPLEALLVEALGPTHEELLNIRLRCAGLAADGVAVDRRIAPADDGRALFVGDALEDALALQSVMLFHRQKAHGHAVGSRLGQLQAKLAAFAREKRVRNLNQNAGAVAGLRVASGSAAMRQIDQNLKTLANDLMTLFAANMGDESHAASIVFVAGMIKSLRLRCA